MASFLAKGGSLLRDPDTPDWAANTGDESKADSGVGRHGAVLGADGKYHIPGYTGFIPNSSEIAGRSYGKMTERALNNPVEKLLVGDQIPPSPQATHEITTVPTTTVVGLAEAAPRHIPGYTGFVPNTREKFGETYGSTSAASVQHVMDSEEGRRALNETSLKRVSFPVHHAKPVPTVDGEGLHLKFAPS